MNVQAHAKVFALLFSTSALLFSGCHVANRIYRPVGNPNATPPVVDQSAIVVPPPPHLPMAKGTAWPPHPETPCSAKVKLTDRPCLAFMEFDDFGESWQKNPSGRPAQLERIIGLIDTAKAEDPLGQPIILTFLHGWEHNASAGHSSGGDDSMIVGFASVLNQIHERFPGRAVLGIYFAWRGALVSSNWPVSQQLTYWNRGATAKEVGNTSLTEALLEISDTARSGGDCPLHCAVLVYVGHSFGALALERALSQATTTRMEHDWAEARTEAGKTGKPGPVPVHPLANLVIYVNSAAAAIESKQLMDYLASSGFTYQPGNGRYEPLFLSVTSEADLTTGLALKVGNALPLVGYKWNGSVRDKPVEQEAGSGPTSAYARACFDPSARDPHLRNFLRFDLSQSDYYMSTAAHLQPLWSHQVTATREQRYQPVSDPPCSANTGDGSTYMTCHIGGYTYTVSPVKDRCNGTPYWIMEVPKEIIPDHDTIFTARLISFLMPFLESTITEPAELAAPEKRE
jgi:hypothetical protein